MERPAGHAGAHPLARAPRQRDRARWHTPVDFTKGLLKPDDFARIYAPGTRQNKAGKPGLYRFFLAHTWTTSLLPDGPYRIEVEASDQRGNTGGLALPVVFANNV